MIDKLLQLIAPVSCQMCGVSGALCCPDHFLGLEPTPVAIGEIQGVFARELDDSLHRVLSSFKDRSVTALAKDLALMAIPLTRSSVWQEADVVIHPPSTRRAYRKRGFVPTRLVLQRLEQPLLISTLQLTRQPLDQRGLDAPQRERNLAGAYQAPPLAGSSVVLFDDVMTTSATIQEMARAVRVAGGRVTGFCVLARKLLDSQAQASNQA